jgi:hypothetical protein
MRSTSPWTVAPYQFSTRSNVVHGARGRQMGPRARQESIYVDPNPPRVHIGHWTVALRPFQQGLAWLRCTNDSRHVLYFSSFLACTSNTKPVLSSLETVAFRFGIGLKDSFYTKHCLSGVPVCFSLPLKTSDFC